MRIMLEKAPKTLIRLSDPGPIEKSPLCNVYSKTKAIKKGERPFMMVFHSLLL